MWITYARGTLIQERTALRSAWDVWLPELDLRIGRVESYFEEAAQWRVRWRSLDHWYHDFRKGYATREEAAQELAAQAPRAVKLIQARRERLALVQGG